MYIVYKKLQLDGVVVMQQNIQLYLRIPQDKGNIILHHKGNDIYNSAVHLINDNWRAGVSQPFCDNSDLTQTQVVQPTCGSLPLTNNVQHSLLYNSYSAFLTLS